LAQWIFIQHPLSYDVDVIRVSVASQDIPRSPIRTITIGEREMLPHSGMESPSPIRSAMIPRLEIQVLSKRRPTPLENKQTAREYFSEKAKIPMKSVSILRKVSFIIHVV
jgi:hypothetical protein